MSHSVDNHAAEPAAEPAVQARGLRKRFGDFTAVKGIDVTIPRGVCFGFLGPNGAGKSTTMRMIYRASDVDEGALSVLGYDASVRANDRAIKARIGVVHQEDNLDEDLTVRETIEVFARFHRLKGAAIERKVHELLAFADLSEREHHKVRALSGGMKRRLMIARGLVGDPELVVLDEPTTGLDPRARAILWDKLSALKRQRATLILTTHYMDEAERLCDRIAIMDEGRIVAEDGPLELHLHDARRGVIADELELGEAPPEGAARWAGVERAEVFGDRLLLYTATPERAAGAALAQLPGRRVLTRRGTLDDVFLRLTGHGLDDT